MRDKDEAKIAKAKKLEMKERKANPKHYWRYRMHLNLEDLMAATAFNESISELIMQSGRK